MSFKNFDLDTLEKIRSLAKEIIALSKEEIEVNQPYDERHTINPLAWQISYVVDDYVKELLFRDYKTSSQKEASK